MTLLKSFQLPAFLSDEQYWYIYKLNLSTNASICPHLCWNTAKLVMTRTNFIIKTKENITINRQNQLISYPLKMSVIHLLNTLIILGIPPLEVVCTSLPPYSFLVVDICHCSQTLFNQAFKLWDYLSKSDFVLYPGDSSIGVLDVCYISLYYTLCLQHQWLYQSFVYL